MAIQKINPEEFIEQHPANYYQIYFVTEKEVLPWNGSTFSSLRDNKSSLIDRTKAVEQYHSATSYARDYWERQPVNARTGRLDLIPINIPPFAPAEEE